MFIYPYKLMNTGKFTKWIVSITTAGGIVVEHRFKGKRKSQTLFENEKDIKDSDIPKNIKDIALSAKYESKGLGL